MSDTANYGSYFFKSPAEGDEKKSRKPLNLNAIQAEAGMARFLN
jgi:hypothetical protein